jgi:hypothetical protein
MVVHICKHSYLGGRTKMIVVQGQLKQSGPGIVEISCNPTYREVGGHCPGQ